MIEIKSALHKRPDTTNNRAQYTVTHFVGEDSYTNLFFISDSVRTSPIPKFQVYIQIRYDYYDVNIDLRR